MKQFKQPTLTPGVQAMRDRRHELMRRAKGRKRDRATAAEKLEAEYSLKVYTPEEVKAFVAERPELETATVIGNRYWDSTKPNFTR